MTNVAQATAVHLIAFARTPAPGRVKTRLIGPLTPEQASELHAAMVADTAELLASVPLDAERRILYTGEAPSISLPKEVSAGVQAAGDLGARLAASFEEAFDAGARKVIIVGSDTPHLPVARFYEANKSLEAADVVLCPTEDGGFYLIGARTPVAFSVLSGIEWGSARVFEQTAASLKTAGYAVTTLPLFYDLDEWKDLERLMREGENAPRTHAYLAKLFRPPRPS